MGRPPKIKSPAEMEEKMEAYFAWCDANPILVETITKNGSLLEKHKPHPYVLEELAVELDFCSVQEFTDYCGARDHERKTPMSAEEKANRKAYVHLITRAKSKIAGRLVKFGELGVYDSKITGLVLATHHGYHTKNKEEVDQNWVITFEDASDEKKSKRKTNSNEDQDV